MLFDLKAISSPCHCFQDQKWHKNANEGAKNTAADEKSAEYMITLSNHKILTCKKESLSSISKGAFLGELEFYSQLRFSDAVFCVFRKVVKFSWDACSSCESLSWNAAKDIIKFLCAAAPGICASSPPLSPSKQKWKQQSVVELLHFLLRCVSIIVMLLSHPSFWLLGHFQRPSRMSWLNQF